MAVGQGRSHQDDGLRRHIQRRQPREYLRRLTQPTPVRWKRAKWATSLPASRSCRRPKLAIRSRIDQAWLRRGGGNATEALAGFKEIQPQVFAGLYPLKPANTIHCATRLEKLKLNDASLQYEPEVSQALGFGFRCGFLGLLHMEIVQERLEREFDQDLITTAPSVVYQVMKNDGEVIMVEKPFQNA
jgi:hypothetical protein